MQYPCYHLSCYIKCVAGVVSSSQHSDCDMIAKIKPRHVLDFISHVLNEFCFIDKMYLEF